MYLRIFKWVCFDCGGLIRGRCPKRAITLMVGWSPLRSATVHPGQIPLATHQHTVSLTSNNWAKRPLHFGNNLVNYYELVFVYGIWKYLCKLHDVFVHPTRSCGESANLILGAVQWHSAARNGTKQWNAAPSIFSFLCADRNLKWRPYSWMKIEWRILMWY